MYVTPWLHCHGKIAYQNTTCFIIAVNAVYNMIFYKFVRWRINVFFSNKLFFFIQRFVLVLYTFHSTHDSTNNTFYADDIVPKRLCTWHSIYDVLHMSSYAWHSPHDIPRLPFCTLPFTHDILHMTFLAWHSMHDILHKTFRAWHPTHDILCMTLLTNAILHVTTFAGCNPIIYFTRQPS